MPLPNHIYEEWVLCCGFMAAVCTTASILNVVLTPAPPYLASSVRKT